MATIADAFALAQKHQRADEFRQAEQIYKKILQADPANARVWFSLGTAYRSQGKLPEAASSFQQSARLKPDDAEAHAQLGLALADAGKWDEALAPLQQALRQNPNHADAHYFLGTTLAALGKLEQAVVSYEQVVRLRPDHVDAYAAMGIALARQGLLDDAVANLQQALRLRPDFAKAHNNLGVALAELGKRAEALRSWQEAVRHKPDYAEAHFNLAVALAEERKYDEAVAGYQQAITHNPQYADAYNNLGLALTEQGRFADAVAVLQQAVRLRPHYAEAHNNLGLALVELGRYDETIDSFQTALRQNPSYPEALNNFGTALAAMGRTQDALAVYQVALWQRPDYAEVRWNRALSLLQLGRYEEGWREYDWRWKRKRARPRSFTQPLWDGSDLADKTILLYCEQGLGDTLQFIRYARLVKERGATVVVECPPELRPLLLSCPGIDSLVAEGEPLPDFDVQAPLLSLPALFHTTLATVPAQVPYLFPEPERVERWRKELVPVAGAESSRLQGSVFKIGIAWQGNPKHRWDRHRSFPLTWFQELGHLEGVQLYSLQKGPGTEQINAAAGRFPLIDFGERLDADKPFLDTAALMHCLDLVITCDSVLAHLAGALGVKVWVALSALVDWRWMFQREDTPWYPTMRLFRQQELGKWDEVFRRMSGDVRERVGRARRGPRPIAAPVSPGELIDKLTILQIKSERGTRAEQLANVRRELTLLEQVRDQSLDTNPEVVRLTAELKAVNETLWDAEDEIRACERKGDFGARFVELARSVYRHNDRRSQLKARLNALLGSDLTEEKFYSR